MRAFAYLGGAALLVWALSRESTRPSATPTRSRVHVRTSAAPSPWPMPIRRPALRVEQPAPAPAARPSPVEAQLVLGEDLAPEPDGLATVLVLDQSGYPLADVYVSLIPEGLEKDDEGVVVEDTDADGIAHFQAFVGVTYRAVVDVFVEEVAEGTLVGGSSATVVSRVPLLRCRLYGDDGAPVSIGSWSYWATVGEEGTLGMGGIGGVGGGGGNPDHLFVWPEDATYVELTLSSAEDEPRSGTVALRAPQRECAVHIATES